MGGDSLISHLEQRIDVPYAAAELDLVLDLVASEVGETRRGERLAGDLIVASQAVDPQGGRDDAVLRKVIIAVVALELSRCPVTQLLRAALAPEHDALPQGSRDRHGVVESVVLNLLDQGVLTSGHAAIVAGAPGGRAVPPGYEKLGGVEVGHSRSGFRMRPLSAIRCHSAPIRSRSRHEQAMVSAHNAR